MLVTSFSRKTMILDFILGVLLHVCHGKSPNIIYIVTDDEDQMLGSSFPKVFENGPLAKTEEVLVKRGMVFDNMYIHVPICNPSRSTTLTGKYFHNIRGTDTAAATMHVNMDLVHNATFARALQSIGYKTGLFGKYSNAMPSYVPLGWNAWLANNGGNYMNPQFQTLNGSYVVYDGKYSTAVIGNTSIEWIEKQSSPFFAYIGPKACHEPFNPAPWYADYWDPAWPSHEIRGPAWNASYQVRADHAANIPTQSLLSDQAAVITTGIFKNRWRTLLSVDDLIYELVTKFFDSNTYVFFTSDHGFHTGHLNMIMDKRHVYDFDTHVHLVVAGPGISPASTTPGLATNVDLAPTILNLAALHSAHTQRTTALFSNFLNETDGRSLLPLLFSNVSQQDWRTSVLIEYFYNDENTKCVAQCNASEVQANYPEDDANCVSLLTLPNQDCWGPGCVDDCYPSENNANNFIAFRLINATHNLVYAKYETGNQTANNITFSQPDFIEVFNVTADPWNLLNLAELPSFNNNTYAQLDADLMTAFACSGPASDCP